jgi:hypothetical protein
MKEPMFDPHGILYKNAIVTIVGYQYEIVKSMKFIRKVR